MRWTLALLAAAALAVGSHQLKSAALSDRAGWPREEEYKILPPASAAPVLYAGYRELAADITWMRALVYYGSSQVGESDFRYLERFIDNVVALDPRFTPIYQWAASAVMFKSARATQDEIRLSIKYLERGIREYPDDAELHYRLGLRYYLDADSPDPAERQRYAERGAELIERAMRMPGAKPGWATQAAAFRSKLGQLDHALSELREMILTTDNPGARAAMLRRYRDLAGDPAVVEALEDAATEFEYSRLEHHPYLPDGLFVLLGAPPDPAIDFADLATERDLFGSEDPDLGEPAPAP